MKIVVNGQRRDAPDGTSVRSLLDLVGAPQSRIAVEVNGRVISSTEQSLVILREHDRVEVVHFVGGG